MFNYTVSWTNSEFGVREFAHVKSYLRACMIEWFLRATGRYEVRTDICGNRW